MIKLATQSGGMLIPSPELPLPATSPAPPSPSSWRCLCILALRHRVTARPKICRRRYLASIPTPYICIWEPTVRWKPFYNKVEHGDIETTSKKQNITFYFPTLLRVAQWITFIVMYSLPQSSSYWGRGSKALRSCFGPLPPQLLILKPQLRVHPAPPFLSQLQLLSQFMNINL